MLIVPVERVRDINANSPALPNRSNEISRRTICLIAINNRTPFSDRRSVYHARLIRRRVCCKFLARRPFCTPLLASVISVYETAAPPRCRGERAPSTTSLHRPDVYVYISRYLIARVCRQDYKRNDPPGDLIGKLSGYRRKRGRRLVHWSTPRRLFLSIPSDQVSRIPLSLERDRSLCPLVLFPFHSEAIWIRRLD